MSLEWQRSRLRELAALAQRRSVAPDNTGTTEPTLVQICVRIRPGAAPENRVCSADAVRAPALHAAGELPPWIPEAEAVND
ncbi:MAG: hypothetical protein JSS29_01485 [Proteobacteria bacterium]|nr:hypothetical protein [Pseudomonadota bacterium]